MRRIKKIKRAHPEEALQESADAHCARKGLDKGGGVELDTRNCLHFDLSIGREIGEIGNLLTERLVTNRHRENHFM